MCMYVIILHHLIGNILCVYATNVTLHNGKNWWLLILFNKILLKQYNPVRQHSDFKSWNKNSCLD